MELFLGQLDSVFVRRIDDEDEALGVLVVVSPEESDFVLSPDVPDGEFDFLVLESLDVEADGWD